jgi:hypothetical protein
MYSGIWSVSCRETVGRVEPTDADDACWLLWRIVEDALPNIIVKMRAVVVCLDCIALGIVSICVESIEVGADSLDGREVLFRVSRHRRARAKPSVYLDSSSTSLKRLVSHTLWLPKGLVADG